MKKIIKSSLSLLLLTMLFACNGSQTSSVAPTSQSTTSQPTEETSIPQEDFTIVTEDNGLSVAESSFLFSTAADDDQFPPEASIRLMTDRTWNGCTGLLDRETKIIAENEDVLPEGSVSLDIVKNSDIVGSSGSNEIYAIDVELDRTKVKPGQSKLKIQVHPNNGSSTISKNTVICVDITIKEYGTIEVDTYNLNLNLDLTGLDTIIEENSATVTSITFSIGDDAPSEEVYGYSADQVKQVPIEISDTYTSVSMENIKYAVGHEYFAQVFVEGEKVSDRIWIALEPKQTSPDYSFTVNSTGNSTFVVEEDNLTIDLKLSDYRAL